MRLVAIGGSDAGISAALRARELEPGADVAVIVADEYPNFSICGIPYYVSGEVPDWRNLAHRTAADLEATGMRLHLGTTAERIDVDAHEVQVRDAGGSARAMPYDALVIGTGAFPVRPPTEIRLCEFEISLPAHLCHFLHRSDAPLRIRSSHRTSISELHFDSPFSKFRPR